MGRTVWIFGDQLTRLHTGLAAADKNQDVVFFAEPLATARERKYHKIKLVMLYSAMRHFAEDLQKTGWSVDYHLLAETETYAAALEKHLSRFASNEILAMEPNSWSESDLLRSLAKHFSLRLTTTPTRQFLVPRVEFAQFACGKKRLLMEHHYHATRVKFGILVDDAGRPEGGAWNFDSSNRKTLSDWKKDGSPLPPPSDRSPEDAIVRAVRSEVARHVPKAFGTAEKILPPVTRSQALKELDRFVKERLVHFGNYQDLMLADEAKMFHSLISAPLNLGLLDPLECVEAAVVAYEKGQAPLEAVEGFVRQIIGWREFVNGIYWLKMPAYVESNTLSATRDLPDFFYTGNTDMNCLRHVLAEVHTTGYNHHIQRLMVLGNFLLLAGISPQQAYAWFLEMYVDAYDWVMAANVLGMALHADGGFMATKPYAASGTYISKMGNYCSGCTYDPKIKVGAGACPYNLLYWDFFDRHAKRFAANPRTSMAVNAWRKRPSSDRDRIRHEAQAFLISLEEA